MKLSYLDASKEVFKEVMQAQHISVIDTIVYSFAMLVQSNCLILAPTMTKTERQELMWHV